MKKKVTIGPIVADEVTLDEAVGIIANFAADRTKVHHVVTPNPEMLMIARDNKPFSEIIIDADLALPDGIGLLMAAELLEINIPNILILRELLILYHGLRVGLIGLIGRRFAVLPERVSGIDTVERLFSCGRKFRVYLLGGGLGKVVNSATESITSNWPNIEVVGSHNGGLISSEGVGVDDKETIEMINNCSPDILLVAFGAPKQDLWIANYKSILSVGVAIGVGGTLEFFAGEQRRAPKGLSRLGLEWLWRLILQPKRAMRILNAFPLFAIYISRLKLCMVKYPHGATRGCVDSRQG